MFLTYSLIITLVAPSLALHNPGLRDPSWYTEHAVADLHFRQVGSLIGSINFAHLFLDVDLAHLNHSLSVLCDNNVYGLGKKGNMGINSFYKGAYFSAAHLLEERCLNLQDDFNNLRMIWMDDLVLPDRPPPDIYHEEKFVLPDHSVIPRFEEPPPPLSNDIQHSFARKSSELHRTTIWPNRTEPYSPRPGRHSGSFPDPPTYVRGPLAAGAANQSDEWWSLQKRLSDYPGAAVFNSPPSDPYIYFPRSTPRPFPDDSHFTSPPMTPLQGEGESDVLYYLPFATGGPTYSRIQPPDNTSYVTITTGAFGEPIYTDHVGVTPTIRARRHIVPHRAHRHIRQVLVAMVIGMGIAALASYLFSHSQLASLSLSSGTSDHAIQVMQTHEARVTINERAIQLLNRTLGLIVQRDDQLAMDDYILRAMTSHSEAEAEIRRIMSGIKTLYQHRLDPVLIKPALLRSVLNKLASKARDKGLILASEEPERVFGYECSHVIFVNHTLRIIVHIPAYREDSILTLFEYVPLPLPYGAVKFILPHPEAHILAINKENSLFRTLTRDQLNMCNRLLDLYWCKHQNMFDRRVESSCLTALFLNNITGVRRNCRITLQPQKDYMVQLNSSDFLLFQSDQRQVEKQCEQGQTRQTWRFRGVRLLTVEPGCRIISPAFIFEGGASIFGEAINIDERPIDLDKIFDTDELRRLKTITQEEYHSLSKVGQETGIHIEDLARGFQSSESAQIFNFGIISFLLFIAVTVGCLCLARLDCCNRLGVGLCLLCRRAPAPAEGAVHYHPNVPNEADQLEAIPLAPQIH